MFCERLGIDLQEARDGLEQCKLTEPSTDLEGGRGAISTLVAGAIKRLREDKGEAETAVGRLIADLLTEPSDARALLQSLQTKGDWRDEVNRLKEVRVQEDDPAGRFKQISQNIGEAAWKQSQDEMAQANQTLQELKEQEYALHPERFEARVNLSEALAATDPLQWVVECKRAAENEARIRRAPLVTLDHMIFCTLSPGLDTTKFLEENGVDWRAWRTQLDIELPTFEVGPRWPEMAWDLGMSQASPIVFLREPGPDGKEHRPAAEKMTDLSWLLAAAGHPQCLSYQLLQRAGLSDDDVRFAVNALERDDPDWHDREPAVAERMKEAADRLDRSAIFPRILREAAQYYARKRGAVEVAVDDVLRAVLQPGTDTAALLADMGIDRQSLLNAQPLEQASPPAEVKFPSVMGNSLFLILPYSLSQDLSDLVVVSRAWSDRARGAPLQSRLLPVLEAAGLTQTAVDQRLAEKGISLSPHADEL